MGQRGLTAFKVTFAVMLAAAAVAWFSGTDTAETVATQGTIAADAFPDAPPDQLALMKEGAAQLTQDKRCPRIELADVSSRGTPDNPAFYFTCDAGDGPFNVHLSAQQIEAGRGAQTVSLVPASVDTDAAVEACRGYARGEATLPTTVEFSSLSTSAYTAPNGNVRVVLPFTAQSGAGTEAPYEATCLVTTEGEIEASVQPR